MMPPLITVGSSPPASSSVATSEVVVVLPCVPATATQDLKPHQLGQHLGPAHDRQAALAGRGELRIVAPDRRRDDDDLGAVDVLGLVADEGLDALLRQPLDVVVVGGVRALHRVAEIAP